MITSFFKPKTKDDSLSSGGGKPKMNGRRVDSSSAVDSSKKMKKLNYTDRDLDLEKENKSNAIVTTVTPNKTVKIGTETKMTTTKVKFMNGQLVKKVRCVHVVSPLWPIRSLF